MGTKIKLFPTDTYIADSEIKPYFRSMGKVNTGGTYVIIIGLILLLDSFVTVQNFFTGGTQTFVNMFEFLLGIVTIGVGFHVRGLKA